MPWPLRLSRRSAAAIFSPPQFLFLLLLALLTCTVCANPEFDIFRYECPNRCICVPDVDNANLLVIDCQLDTLAGAKTFDDFPKNATKALRLRCLSHQHESELVSDMFEEFNKLRDLKISNCHTKSVPLNLFRGLSSLKTLYLERLSAPKSDAAAPTFAAELFEPTQNLQKLTIIESTVTAFPDGFFCPLHNLQILNLTSNNLVRAQLDSTRCPLEQLLILDLSDNKIESLQTNDFQAFPALRQLSLVGNQISDLQKDTFKSLPLLQHLDLKDNQIRELVFLPESLLHLNLARNQLPLIPASVANLEKLISGNFSHNHIGPDSPFTLLSTSLESVDLSGNKLDALPVKILQQSVASLLYLHLSDNEITMIQPSQLQNFTRLQKLDLSRNRIKTLNEDCFSGLGELVELDLSHNVLYHIDVGVFAPVAHRLQRLDLSQNVLIELPMAVGRLAKVKILDLSGNQLSKLYKFVLSKMKHLNSLNLRHNRLSVVDSYVFGDCVHLTELDLADNRIESVTQDAFDKCPRLRVLDFANNRLTAFNGAIMAIDTLRTLNASGNLFESLEWSEFPDDLWTLDLSRNRVGVVAPASGSHVKKLYLHQNLLKRLSVGQLSAQIEQVDFARNQIESVETGVFAALKDLKLVDLRHNRLKTLPKSVFAATSESALLTTQIFLEGNALHCHCELAWAAQDKLTLQLADKTNIQCLHALSHSNVSISTLTEADFLCPYEQTCEPNCICCQYGNCDCKSKCPAGCNCFHNLDFQTNVVQCVGGALSPKALPMHASHILLESLRLPTLKTNDFMSRTRLVELRINASGIRVIQPLAFNTLPSLRKLDLSSNALTELRGDEFFKTVRVQHLDLHNNDLYELDARLGEQLPNVETVLLHENSFDELPELISRKENLKSVSLAANPFRCDCNWRRFRLQSWLPENLPKILDAQDVICAENVTAALRSNDTTVLSSFPPNKGFDMFEFPLISFVQEANRSFCALEPEGIFGRNSQQSLAMLLGACVFVLLTLCALVFVVTAIVRRAGRSKHRYKKATPSLNCSTGTAGCSPLPVPLIQYDAFVSYSKRDEPLVLNHVCRVLEHEDYSLCLLHQEGSKYAYNQSLHTVSDELIHQLEASQTLILVLTRNFLENEWRTLQIKTSHQLFAKMQNKRLIAVLGPDVCPNELDNELGSILRKNTCLRYSDHLFVNLLLSSMPTKLVQHHSGSSTVGSEIYSEMYGSVVPSDVV